MARKTDGSIPRKGAVAKALMAAFSDASAPSGEVAIAHSDYEGLGEAFAVRRWVDIGPGLARSHFGVAFCPSVEGLECYLPARA